MYIFKSIWRFSNLLSLDVVLGAMAGMLFFEDVLNVVVPVESYLILAMAVWSIYTLDHLWDARVVREKASLDRHRFHQQNFWILSWILIFTIISGLVIVLLTPHLKFILIPGLFLGFMMLVWMSILHLSGKKLSWLKEVSTSVFYVLGISLAPFFKLLPNEIPFPFYLFLIGYFSLAFVNLLILSFLDEKEDKRDGFGSILQHVRKPQLKKYINFLGVISAIMMMVFVIILPSYFKIHASILLLLILFHILEFQKNDQGKTREKLEASFLLPFLLLLF